MHLLTCIQILISEGEDLTAQSNSLLETFFGPKDKATSFEDFAADDHDSDVHASNSKNLREGSVPDAAEYHAIHRQNTGGLIDESVGMHKQGAHLVEEGNKLVSQGRRLLRTIFGSRTDEYIKNITQARAATAKAGSPMRIDLSKPDELDVDVEAPNPEGYASASKLLKPAVDIDFYDADARDEDTDFDTDFDTE